MGAKTGTWDCNVVSVVAVPTATDFFMSQLSNMELISDELLFNYS